MSTDDIRLSDNERMVALQALGTHYAEGRISSAEFNERTTKVAEAQTYSALTPLFGDLPGGVPFTLVSAGLTPNVLEVQSEDPGLLELKQLKSRGKLIEQLDLAFTVVGMIVFFLGMYLGWGYFWLALVASGGAMMLSRALLQYDETDEKTFESLQKKEAKEKKQRLLDAEKRMRELGQ
ncbi:DUF1707 domain-containing protein [Corynebacterium hindlerae]|uniref:DUF1707 SHOCT-like domain-containing protein n=1 Tax=Corynebacterium hindlerae TaxID=699041 RepID=UPI001AD7B2EB|nr:DUF1707 domain-containing protein [Corynebacterium hindlerae]QTH60519.1 DUF1707 domain-containing protein [Corynebacterium hindlerae]